MRKLLIAMMCVLAISGHAQTPVTINPMNRLQTVEGWGVSLCWWAAQAGQWDDAKINEIADWLVSPDGLNYNVFRYNIPGGDDPGHNKCVEHHMQKGKGLRAEMDGFIKDKHAPGDWDNWVYDWTADEAQIKMLRAIVAKAKEYGKEDILKIEAFSNSCPWWMTVSGCVSGSVRGGKYGTFSWQDAEQETNLKSDYYDDFARYLVDVCKHFKEVEGIEFYTLEPFNEPYANNYWTQGIQYQTGINKYEMGGTQEGCYVKPADQIDFVKKYLAPELANSSLNTIISVSDETNLKLSAEVWDLYAKDAEVMSKITQWNTHSYDGSNSERTNLRDKVKNGGKRLWMSETGDMSNGASEWTLCQKLFNDMNYLQPVVWCDWQVMEPLPLWSTIQCGGSNNKFDSNNYWRNLNYYVRKQVTSNIKVGYTILSTSNANVLAAVSPEDDEVVVCLLNTSTNNASYNLNISNMPGLEVKEATITDETRNCADHTISDITNISVPKKSIVTVVLRGPKVVYLRNRATGRYLKSGGNWGTHSIVGNYPVAFKMVENNGKYALKCDAGYVSCEADNTQTFVDTDNGNSVKDWGLIEQDGFYVFAHGGRALSANDPYFFNDDPNYRWVILDALNPTDKLQQWEVLTKNDMMAEIAKASKDNPINVSWLMGNPNFDRNFSNAKWENSINSSATRMTSNLEDGKNEDTAEDNFVGEAYVKNCPKSHWGNCDHSTRWDINQTITGVPNGWYRISCQAFQRISNSTGTTETIELYGNNVAQQVELMYNLKEITTSGMGSTKDGNYYYPNTMSEASQYFLKGYYQNSVWVNVTDGTLKVGIRKTSDTDKNNNAWCCFDNFQIYYFGAEKPSDNLGVNVIADTRKAEMVNGALKLTGTWREVDMAELATKVNEEKTLLIDASETNYLICRPEIQTANAPANMMIKVAKADEIANTQNVIAEGKCANFVVTDKKEFGPQQTFTAQKVSYARSNTQGYNTVCMPFALTVNDFPETCTVYKYTRQTEGTAYFEEVGDDETIEAGTPVLVKDNTDAEGAAAKWEMNIVSSRGVVPAVNGNTEQNQQEGLNGSFLARSLGEGYFKLNSAGTKFVKTTSSSTITPFRFYLKDAVGGSAKAFDVVLNDEETAIEDIVNDPETRIEEIYDVSGRKVLRITRPGLYIMGGKKVLKR